MSLHALPSHAKQVPPDSFFVLSLKSGKIIEQSSIKKSLTWDPILHDWGNRNPSMLEFLIDMNASGVNFDRPIHIFSRLQGTKNPDPVIGVLATVQDKEMVDSTLANFAEVLGFTKNKGKSIRYKKDNLPIEFGRNGKIFHILGIGPVISDQSSAKQELDQFFQLISKRPKVDRFPNSLTEHFSDPSDLSLYIDGSG